MFTRPSAPLTIGGVLDNAIRLYTGSMRLWLVPSLVGALLIGGAALVIGFIAAPLGQPLRGAAATAAALAIFKSPVLWCGYLAMLVISVWSYVTVFVTLNAGYENQAISATRSMLAGLKLLPRSVLATLYTMVFTFIGFVLLVIPGLYLMGRWFYWLPALGTERIGAMAAIRRSYELTSGHWWRGVVTVSVAVIMIMVLTLAVGIVLGISFVLLVGNTTAALLLTQGISALVRAFTLPMLPAVLVVGYRDLVMRKEGGDLAQRVGGLAAT
jgi:hypothetical protein